MRGDGVFDLAGVVAAVGPDEFESRRNPRAFRCRSEAILDNMRASLPHAIHNAPSLRVFMCAAACWAIRPLAVGRKNYLFAGSDEGGHRAAIIHTLIETARLNDVDPEAWLGDVISRIADHPNTKIDELLPWKWTTPGSQAIAA